MKLRVLRGFFLKFTMLPLATCKGACLILVFLTYAGLIYGQAADMEQLLGAQKITWEQAAYFSLGAARETAPADPREAFTFVREQGWLPKNARAEENAAMNGVSLLLMRSFAIPGGLMYRIFPNARYAYRELKSRGFIQGRVYASDSVSGAAFLQLLSELLSYSGDTETLEAEAARRRLLEDINESLRNSAKKSEGIRSGSEDVQGYDSKFELQ